MLVAGAVALLGVSLFGWGKDKDDDKNQAKSEKDARFGGDFTKEVGAKGSDSLAGTRGKATLSDNGKPDVVFFVGMLSTHCCQTRAQTSHVTLTFC